MREDPELQPISAVFQEIEACGNAYVNTMPQADMDSLRGQLEQWWLTNRGQPHMPGVAHGWDLFNVGDVLAMGVEAFDEARVFPDDEAALLAAVTAAHDLDQPADHRRAASCAVLLHQLANEARRRAWGNGNHNRRTPPQPGEKPPVAFQPDYPDEVTQEQLDAIQKLAYKDGVPKLRKIGEPGW